MNVEGLIANALVSSLVLVVLASLGWVFWFGKFVERVRRLETDLHASMPAVADLQTDATRSKTAIDYLTPAVSKLESAVADLQTDTTRSKMTRGFGDD